MWPYSNNIWRYSSVLTIKYITLKEEDESCKQERKWLLQEQIAAYRNMSFIKELLRKPNHDILWLTTHSTVLQNRKFAAISGYFTKFEISKKLFVIGLLTLLAIWNNAKINSELLGTLGKFYLKFDKIAVFHNFLIFYAIPKKFGQICVWFYIPHKNLRYIWGIWIMIQKN